MNPEALKTSTLKAVVGTFMERELNEALKGAFSGTEWSLQGFGMLRAYMHGKAYRLHVWDSRFRVPNVTLLHDHPWDFDSVCVAGRVVNTRFLKSYYGELSVMEQAIVCGPGGGVHAEPFAVNLEPLPDEVLQEGGTYTQHANEIHRSEPEDGTVTIIERHFHENTEVAHVFYRADAGWVSAEPAPADPDTVADILRYSLETWWS